MPHADLTLLNAQLRRMVTRETLTDEELIRRFAESRDAAAFEVLVWRHGPMVWATCQRILRHRHDAEDAFQATFLALTRAARSIGNGHAVGGWLHRVAVNASLKLKAKRMTTGLPADVAARGGDDPPGGELSAALDEELLRLPDRVRAAFVLCCLEGMTSTEAARELGCPAGTVDSRLHAARTRLRDRLARRGFGPGALTGLIAAALPPAVASAAAIRAGAGFMPNPAVGLLAAQARGMMMRGSLTTKGICAAALAIIVAGTAWVVGGPGDTAPALVTPLVAAPAPRPAPRGEGRIVLWREGHLISVHPGTKEVLPLAKGFEGKRGNLWLSPDGKQVLVHFANRPTLRPADPEQRDRVFVKRADGDAKDLESGEIKVEDTSLCHAFWGADGKMIFGYGLVLPKGGDPPPDPDLTTDQVNWSYELQTRKLRRLKLSGNVSVLDRSADGESFLVIRYEKLQGDPWAYKIGFVPADGGPFVALTREKELSPADFRFSPDGRSVLGSVYREEGSRLFRVLVVIDLKTLTRTAVAVPKGAHVCASCWSPDGKWVAFAWEPKAAYQKRNGEREGPVVEGREKYELTVTVARPDGSDARNVHTETGYWYGSVDWQ